MIQAATSRADGDRLRPLPWDVEAGHGIIRRKIIHTRKVVTFLLGIQKRPSHWSIFFCKLKFTGHFEMSCFMSKRATVLPVPGDH